jgi:toxin ParE1/3/4
MAEIRWTDEAVRWLQDIYEYISHDSPRSAQKVVKGIYDRAQVLVKFPEIGYIFRKEKDGIVRILLFGHYRIAYIVCDDGSVTILGVFHSALDISRYNI